MQSNYFLGHPHYREMPLHDNVLQIAKGYRQDRRKQTSSKYSGTHMDNYTTHYDALSYTVNHIITSERVKAAGSSLSYFLLNASLSVIISEKVC